MHLATQNTLKSSFPSGTMVEKFIEFFPDLRDNVDPRDITAALLKNKIISNNEKEDADNKMHSRGDRMDHLLSAVQRAIRMDENKFYVFLDVLEKAGGGKYIPLVQKMKGGTKGEV